MILAREAKFAMTYYGSTVLMDACYMGCPTLDYAEYDSRGRQFLDGHSLLRQCADREGMLPVVAAPRLAQAFRRIGQ